MLLVYSQLSPDISLNSTQAGSFQASLRLAIGKRIQVQVFHHVRRLWLKM